MPTTTLAPAALADALKRAWRDGVPPDVRGVLRDHPELLRHRSLVVDLAYEEYCLREEAGRTPAADSFCRDLPAFRSDVREVIRGHRALCDHPELLGRAAVRWPEPGEVFEGFTVVRELGRGAFARAYLATDPDTGDRPVVLKLSPTCSAEARTLGPVRHPHVAEVLWARRVNGVSAICMRYVGATTLRDVIAAAFDGPGGPPTAGTVLTAVAAHGPPPDEPGPVRPVVRPGGSYADAIAALGARLAGALTALHARGVTHGDLKPSNVVLGPGGHPYLIDFNLAGVDGPTLHRYGGTLPYMAPERVRRLLGEPALAGPPDRADVYAFGAVLFEALTGRVPVVPLESPDLKVVAANLLRRQRTGPPRLVAAGVAGRLARLVETCLATDPARRPTAAALRNELDRFTGRRRRWARLAAAAGVVILGGWAIGREAIRPAPAAEAEPVAAVAPAAPAVADPPTADDLIARGFRHLADDPNGAFLDFAQAARLRRDGRTVALMAYARTRSHSPDALRVYTEAIDQLGFRDSWALNNRAYERIKVAARDPGQLAQATADAVAALEASPDLLPARYNRARARFLARLDQARWCLDDERVLDLIEDDLAAVVAGQPGAPKAHMLMAEVLAAPAWADDGRLDRAADHLTAAVALGLSSKYVKADPAVRRALERPGVTARLDAAAPARPPAEVDPGVADPPAP